MNFAKLTTRMPPGFWKITGTGRKLLFAFLALNVYFALASAIALVGITDVREAFARARVNAEGLRLALELSSAVRDQYAHQAHTIILGTQEHIPLYSAAHDRVLEMVAAMEMHSSAPGERKWVAQIAESSHKMDTIFRVKVIPAVVRQDREAINIYHAQILDLVTAIEDSTGMLAKHFEKSIQIDQTYVAAVERRAFYASLIFLLAGPFLAAWVGLYIGRSVARPVNILREGAERLSRGDMETRIEINSKDEFGALANQFNAMTKALRQHQQKLVESERLASVGRLAAGVAHEINNPLGVILGYVRLLKKKGDLDLAGDMAVVEEEVLRCKGIVEGLLDLSRTPKIEHTPLDLHALVKETVERIAESLGAESKVSIHGDANADADPIKLRQVVFNLVKNAIEASGPEGAVDINIGRQDMGYATISVADNGPGVDPKIIDQIFEPFVTTKRNGMGLGLSVCQSIAQAHGGELTMETGTKGSCFTLRIPVRESGGSA